MSQQEPIDRSDGYEARVAAVMAELRRAMQARIDTGLVPVDGQWITPDEARERSIRARRRSRVHAFELVLLYFFSAFFSLFTIALVWGLCY